MKRFVDILFPGRHRRRPSALDFLKFIGPGFLVTAGFIDPGNWAANISAGADFGYKLLWMVTLATIMLILFQHNAAHLGIVTGDCLAESATRHSRPATSKFILWTAMLAAAATAFAEILGGALALQMLFHLPFKIGALLTTAFAVWMLFSNSYSKVERWIIGLVGLVGISFIFELALVRVPWASALSGWVVPVFPKHSMVIVMCVLGAIVMPHNLFLHSEFIQTRKWSDSGPAVIEKKLKFEFMDTLVSMIVGWAINSAIIILAAATFFSHGIHISTINQAAEMLKPLLGRASEIVFALALLMAGLASSVTAGMAGGTIFTGLFRESYDIKDSHTRIGVGMTYFLALMAVFFVSDPFLGLVYSQVCLSVQLPFSIFLLVSLTSSKAVMGKFVNTALDKILLWTAGIVVSGLNILLLLDILGIF